MVLGKVGLAGLKGNGDKGVEGRGHVSSELIDVGCQKVHLTTCGAEPQPSSIASYLKKVDVTQIKNTLMYIESYIHPVDVHIVHPCLSTCTCTCECIYCHPYMLPVLLALASMC